MGTIQIKISDEEKVQVDNLFKDMGFTTAGAIKLFLRQAVIEKSLPFQPKSSQKEVRTVESINNRIDAVIKRGTYNSERLEAVGGVIMVGKDSEPSTKAWVLEE